MAYLLIGCCYFCP